MKSNKRKQRYSELMFDTGDVTWQKMSDVALTVKKYKHRLYTASKLQSVTILNLAISATIQTS